MALELRKFLAKSGSNDSWQEGQKFLQQTARMASESDDVCSTFPETSASLQNQVGPFEFGVFL